MSPSTWAATRKTEWPAGRDKKASEQALISEALIIPSYMVKAVLR